MDPGLPFSGVIETNQVHHEYNLMVISLVPGITSIFKFHFNFQLLSLP